MAKKKGKVVSLDIGSSTLHLAQGRDCGTYAELDLCEQAPMPEGAVRDGVLQDDAAVRAVLSGLLESSSVSADRATVCVKSNSIINREVTLPVVKADEMDQLIQYEMEQYVPNLGKDYITRFVLLEKVDVGGTPQNRLQVSAVPRTMVNSYAELIHSVGLKPEIMDTASNALSKLVDRTRKAAKVKNENKENMEYVSSADPWVWNTAVFLDMGYMTTSVNLFQGEQRKFGRLIGIGNHQLEEELMGGLQVDKQELDRLNQASDLLDEDPGDRLSTMNQIKRDFYRRWINEVQTVLQFYTGRGNEVQADAYYLLGESVTTGNMARFLKRQLDTPVLPMQSVSTLRFVAGGRKARSGIDLHGYITAASAIFRND